MDAAKRSKSEVVQSTILHAIANEVQDNISSDLASAIADYVFGKGTLADVKVQYERLQVS